MRPKLQFIGLALVPAVLYAVLWEQVNRVAYPPPLYTLMVMLFASPLPGSVLEIVAGAAFQVLVFALWNSYLLSRRVRSRLALVWIPSFVAVLVALSFQISITSEVWRRQDYAGSRSALVAGYLMLVASILLAGFRLPHRAVHAVLAVNCLLHCALVAVLFPFVGELA